MLLDRATLDRIKACKNEGFPICLKDAVVQIFGEQVASVLLEKVEIKLGLGDGQTITSSQEIWKIYEETLEELGKGLGKDVSHVISFQSLKEMEAMGCVSCPLYQREATEKQTSANE